MKQKINVAIVEDDQLYRESIQAVINDTDDLNCIFSVSTAEEAHEHIMNDNTPEVILHDIDLPKMSGIESCLKIKQLSASTHIVMLTIYDDDDKIFDAVLNGAEGYLIKDDQTDNILNGIREVVNGGAVMSPNIARKVLNMFTDRREPSQEYHLTPRQKDILKCLTEGLNKDQIADKLFISFYTVDTHLKNIYAKLHVHTQIDLISKVYKERLI